MKGKLEKKNSETKLEVTRDEVTNKETQPQITEDSKYYLLVSFSLALMAIAFLFQSPIEIFDGMKVIMRSSGKLLTDYMELTSIGASFF
ncbi:Putative membrane protein (fragment) [Carnobacterium maltaromaticum]